MILGFKERFVQPIMAGRKKHTIREDKHNRWRSGKQIHFATGVRTKNYNNFKTGTCRSIQKIKIEYIGTFSYLDAEVKVDGKILSNEEINILAKNDGFESIEDFFEWFNKDFKGKIIHWTDFKY